MKHSHDDGERDERVYDYGRASRRPTPPAKVKAEWVTVIIMLLLNLLTVVWYHGQLTARVGELEQEVQELRIAVLNCRAR